MSKLVVSRPAMRPLLVAAIALGVATGGFAFDAAAQQPGAAPAQPGAAQPGAAQPGAPPGAQPGRPIPPRPGGPGAAPPGGARRNPGIQPGFPPGFDPGGAGRNRPLPPGHPTIGGAAEPAAPPAKPKIPRDEHGHCPGHGAMDSLRAHAHINWWQGLLGVDNEKAKSTNALDKLLWRYNNADDECDPANQEPPILAQVINLLVLLGLLFKFGKKPLAEALAKRKKGIVEEMEAARSLGDEAEDRLARYEEQLENLDERRREIHEESAQQWEAEKKRILAEAEERRTRMRRDAEFRVQQDRKSAQQELLRESIESATEAAKELLAQRLQAGDHDRLADEYLASVGAVVRDGARSGGAA